MARRKTADHRWKVFTGSLPSAGQTAATPSASGGPRKPGDPLKSARPGIPPSTSKHPPSLGVPARAPSVKVSSPASVFEKLLRSFETGGFTYSYVLTDLKRLLEANASPAQLLEVLARRQLIEPLPQDAYVEIFAVLDDAAARVAAEAASVAEAKSADADTPPVKSPETTPAPIEPAPPAPRMRPNIAQAKSTQVALRSVFERVLSVFETSGFTDTEVLSQLKRLLLATGASPTMLLEALRRRQLFEPLPEHAHAQVLGLLNEVLGQTESQTREPDILKQTQGPVPTPVAIVASPGSRSPAEVSTAPPSSRSPGEERTVSATPTPRVPPDSVLTKPAAPPPANGPLKVSTPPPVAPSPALFKPESTQPASDKTAMPSAPLAPVPPTPPSSRSPGEERTVSATPTPRMPPDSVLTKPAAPPPANGPLKVSTPPPGAPSPASFKQDSTQPASEKTAAPTAPLAPVPPAPPSSRSPGEERTVSATPTPRMPPDSVLTKPAAPPPANGQLKVSTPPPVAPSPALSKPESTQPAFEKTTPATMPSESAIAKPSVMQPVAAQVTPPSSSSRGIGFTFGEEGNQREDSDADSNLGIDAAHTAIESDPG